MAGVSLQSGHMHRVKTKVIGLSWADEVQLLLTRYDSNIKTVADLKANVLVFH